MKHILFYRGGNTLKPQYEKLINKIQEKKSPAPSWKSDQASIVEIIRYADRNDFDPSKITEIDLCKFRTIIKEAKIAISNDDLERLLELFHLAATLSLVDLRLAVGMTKPSEINVERKGNGEDAKYYLTLLPGQMKRLQQSLRLFYKFTVIDTQRSS